MKRSWFGLALLVLLRAVGLLATWYMGRCQSGTAELLTEAQVQARQGNWEQAVNLSRQAELRWQRSWPATAAFADHEPMENIDNLFAQLKIYAGEGENLSFAALCAQITSDLTAMADSQALNWWNLL